MSPAFPVLSGQAVVRVFENLGWRVAWQNGSHIVMVKTGENVTLSVPNHKTIAKGTLRSLIRASGLTVAEFLSSVK
jgi:predicted RNA binding protein YcfA (HicA-like mRNA interferase family)